MENTINIIINKQHPTPAGFYIRPFILKALQKLAVKEGTFEFTFCTNETILSINATHLNHHYPTDIITFDLSDSDTTHVDIYISVDQVQQNAKDLNISVKTELKTVILHGLLHIFGYDDTTPHLRSIMMAKQDELLCELEKKQ